jgi:hypothetical protein
MVPAELLSCVFPLKSQHAATLQKDEAALCGLLKQFLQEHVSKPCQQWISCAAWFGNSMDSKAAPASAAQPGARLTTNPERQHHSATGITIVHHLNPHS